MIRKSLQSLKNLVLPAGEKYRRIPFGLASGAIVPINFRHNTMLYFGIYEIELNQYFKKLVKKGAKCFDVGADIGYDALMLAQLSGEPVVTFECNPTAIAILRETLSKNPYDIQIIEGFVSSSDGNEQITLDTVAERTFMPDFIKIDIEGGESEALKGACNILASRRPHLIIEVHGEDVEAQCLQFLREYGYGPQLVDQRRWLREGRPIGDVNRWLICEGNMS